MWNCECVYTSCQVNPRFAINLVAEEPVVIIDGNHTYCDGGQLHVLCRGIALQIEKPY